MVKHSKGPDNKLTELWFYCAYC